MLQTQVVDLAGGLRDPNATAELYATLNHLLWEVPPTPKAAAPIPAPPAPDRKITPNLWWLILGLGVLLPLIGIVIIAGAVLLVGAMGDSGDESNDSTSSALSHYEQLQTAQVELTRIYRTHAAIVPTVTKIHEQQLTTIPSVTAADSETDSRNVNEIWEEVSRGQLIYSADSESSAVIRYSSITWAETLGGLEIDSASDDAPKTVEDLILFIIEDVEASMEAQGLLPGIDATVEGPLYITVGDVSLPYIRIIVEEVTSPNGQSQPRQTMDQYRIYSPCW